MAKSKIIRDLANGEVDTITALKRAKVLVSDLNNDVHRIAPFTTGLHVFSLITRGRGEKIARTPQTAFGGQLPFTGEPFRRSCAFTIQSP